MCPEKTVPEFQIIITFEIFIYLPCDFYTIDRIFQPLSMDILLFAKTNKKQGC